MDAKTCQRPFISEDFPAFDKVADARLYKSEIDNSQIDCIVEHLIRTKDSGVREEFNSMVQNDLREAIRERLLALKSAGGLPEDVAARVDHLLEIDYSDDKLTYTATVQYTYNSYRLNVSSEGDNSNYDLQKQGLSGYGALDGKFDIIDKWRLEPSIFAIAEQFWTSENYTYTDENADESSRNQYWGLNGHIGGSALRRDESIRLSAFLEGAYYDEPPPGELETELVAGGDIRLKSIGGSPFSVNAMARWLKDDSTPIDDEMLDPEYEKLIINAEASYMWAKAGLLATYTHDHADSVTSTVAEDGNADSASLLAHATFSNGYLRAGAGGGHWSEENRLLGGDNGSSSGGEVHGTIQGSLSPVESLNLGILLTAYANQSDGTFVGWYPSAKAMLSADIAFGDISLGISGTAEGLYRDLNFLQKRFEYEIAGNISYSPVDYFNASLNVGYSSTDQRDYDAYRLGAWEGSASVQYRIIKDPDIWISSEGNLASSNYHSSEYNTTDLDASIAAYLTLRY